MTRIFSAVAKKIDCPSALFMTLQMFTTDEYTCGLNKEEWYCSFIQNDIADQDALFPFEALQFLWQDYQRTMPSIMIVGERQGQTQERAVSVDTLTGQMVDHLVYAHRYDRSSFVCALEPARHALLRAAVALLSD